MNNDGSFAQERTNYSRAMKRFAMGSGPTITESSAAADVSFLF